MAQKIGYQDGLAGFVGWVRKISLGLVRYRPVDKRPASLEQWYWLEKFERTLRILKDDHDAAIVSPAPEPPPPPPPPVPLLAPQTYNKGSSGQDARYCTTGLQKTGPYFVDGGGYLYDDKGLCLGGRSGNPVAGLKPADEMDGREPCDPYDGFPPWPAGSYDR